MITFLKRNYLWIILLGSLIGLNETLIGGIKIPYLVNYIFARGSMTAVASSAISVFKQEKRQENKFNMAIKPLNNGTSLQ